MHYYPAKVVAVNAEFTTVRLETTGKEIRLAHTAHNAVPAESRHVGATGFISFPKAPAVFTAHKVSSAA